MTIKKVNINFIDSDSSMKTVQAEVGLSILEIAHKYGINLEGACEGSLACSTCHVIIDDEHFAKLPPIADDENDMLDFAFGLTDTSRLGCQIIVGPELEGITVKVPTATRNIKFT